MALKLGTLFVDLAARTTGYSKSMAGALKDAERFTKEAKRITSEVASMSAVIGGIGVAAVKMASSVDGPTKNAMESLEKSTRLLAVQVADLLLPAVREMTSLFRQAAGVVAGLDPEVKKQISSFAVLAVEVAVGAKAFSMFAGLASNVFAVLRAGFAMVAAIGVGPLLNIVAAVGLVIGSVLLLHRAWRKNWGGIQEATKSVLEWFQNAFSQLGEFFGKVWDFIIGGAENFIESILGAVDVLQELTGKKLVDTRGMREGFAGLWKDLKNGSFVSEAFKFGKSIGEQLVDGITDEWKALKSELSLDKIGLKMGTPIGLGRSQRPQGDVSGMGFAADESMREIARRAAADAADQAAAMAAHEGISHSAESPGAHGGTDGDHEINIAAREAAAHIKTAGKTIANSLMQGGGALGQAISNIASAAAQGGPWAAVFAAIMEVFQRMKSFQKMMDTLSYGLERLGQFMEPLVGELFGIVETLTVVGTEMLKPLFDALKPLFDGITKFAKGLIPILSTVGALFEAISPLIEFVGTVVGGILEALKPLLDLVGGVIKGIATVVLGIFIWFNEMAALFGDDKAKAESKRLQGLVDKMWAPAANDLAISQGEAARETWRNAAAQGAAADSAKKVAESLSNVPAGYRIANARYQADLGITAGYGYAGGGGRGAAGGVTINGDVNVTSSSETIGGIAADAKKEAARERGQRTGNPTNRSGSGGRDG